MMEEYNKADGIDGYGRPLGHRTTLTRTCTVIFSNNDRPKFRPPGERPLLRLRYDYVTSTLRLHNITFTLRLWYVYVTDPKLTGKQLMFIGHKSRLGSFRLTWHCVVMPVVGCAHRGVSELCFNPWLDRTLHCPAFPV